MQIKILEIRDKATFIPVLTICVTPRRYSEELHKIDDYYMKERCGYSCDGHDIILMNLGHPEKCNNDPYEWGGRTYPVAHNWIITNWDKIKDGDVIDVEFILGETPEIKTSERLTPR